MFTLSTEHINMSVQTKNEYLKIEMNCLVLLLTQCLLVATQEAITCANVDQDIRRHMASRGTMSVYDLKVPFGKIKTNSTFGLIDFL